jgi:hypothetical protein
MRQTISVVLRHSTCSTLIWQWWKTKYTIYLVLNFNNLGFLKINFQKYKTILFQINYFCYMVPCSCIMSHSISLFKYIAFTACFRMFCSKFWVYHLSGTIMADYFILWLVISFLIMSFLWQFSTSWGFPCSLDYENIPRVLSNFLLMGIAVDALICSQVLFYSLPWGFLTGG